MRFFAAAFVLFTLAGSALPLSITKSNGETSAGHIVMLFKGDKTSLLQQIKDAGGQITSD